MTNSNTQSDVVEAENTDREIWREVEGDYYADSIHVTKQGAIGINCGGAVRVMPVREWHALAPRQAVTDGLLRQVLAAWESLPGGKHYNAKTVQAWLTGPMLDAISAIRSHLKEQTDA